MQKRAVCRVGSSSASSLAVLPGVGSAAAGCHLLACKSGALGPSVLILPTPVRRVLQRR